MQLIPLGIRQAVTNCGHLKGLLSLQRYAIYQSKVYKTNYHS